MTDSMKRFVAYIAGIGVSVFYYFYFLGKYRCMIRESGVKYPDDIGVDKWEGTDKLISCYANWALEPRFVVLPIIMIVMMIHLMRSSSGAGKIATFFFAFCALGFAYLGWVTVSDQFAATYK